MGVRGYWETIPPKQQQPTLDRKINKIMQNIFNPEKTPSQQIQVWCQEGSRSHTGTHTQLIMSHVNLITGVSCLGTSPPHLYQTRMSWTMSTAQMSVNFSNSD